MTITLPRSPHAQLFETDLLADRRDAERRLQAAEAANANKGTSRQTAIRARRRVAEASRTTIRPYRCSRKPRL